MAAERQLQLTFLGPLRRPPGLAQRDVVTVACGTTIEGLLEQLGYDQAEKKRLQLLLDGQPAALTDPLGEAQELAIFLPLGGG